MDCSLGEFEKLCWPEDPSEWDLGEKLIFSALGPDRIDVALDVDVQIESLARPHFVSECLFDKSGFRFGPHD